MTLLFLGLCLVFGFLAFRHFSNGRFIWGTFAALGSLLMAAAVWVDGQRASASSGNVAASDEPESVQPGPKIGDYRPVEEPKAARVHRSAEEANADLSWGKGDADGASEEAPVE